MLRHVIYISCQLRDWSNSELRKESEKKLHQLDFGVTPIKSTTANAIQQLHKLGQKIVMLADDNEQTAQSIANKLSIDEVHAGVTPTYKQEFIQQAKGKEGTRNFILFR